MLNKCIICYDDYKEPRITTCNHKYCYRCIRKWANIKNTCPLCRYGPLKFKRCQLCEIELCKSSDYCIKCQVIMIDCKFAYYNEMKLKNSLKKKRKFLWFK